MRMYPTVSPFVFRASKIGVVALGLVAVSAMQLPRPSESASAAGSFQSAALQPSDLPAGYGKPRTKFFTAYARHMRAFGSSCTVTSSRKVWRGGLISESRQGKTQSITECVYSLKNASAAHDLYLNALKDKKLSSFPSVTVSGIGDEAQLITIHDGPFDVDAVPFRHGTTVVLLTFATFGQSASPDKRKQWASDLEHVASAVNGRL